MKEERPKLIKIRCRRCHSAQTYSLVDRTIVCRKCSYRRKPLTPANTQNGETESQKPHKLQLASATLPSAIKVGAE